MEQALYGQWDMSARDEPFPYDDTITYRKIARFLDRDGVIVEDWGCGGGWLARFIRHATYRGVDGAEAPWVDVQADLRTYESLVERANMRHVLEHNPDWRVIADNFCRSFIQKATLVTWVPFRGEGCKHMPCPQDEVAPSVGDVDHGRGEWPVPDLHIQRADLTDIFKAHGIAYSSSRFLTTSQYGVEEVFYLVR